MKKETKMVYVYTVQCSNCHLNKIIYYTVADFGDEPLIMHCKDCGELYWYTREDEAYIQPIDIKLSGLKCERCNAVLKDSLVPTHKNIVCCGSDISLDDDFAGNTIPPDTEMVPVEVYLIYS